MTTTQRPVAMLVKFSVGGPSYPSLSCRLKFVHAGSDYAGEQTSAISRYDDGPIAPLAHLEWSTYTGPIYKSPEMAAPFNCFDRLSIGSMDERHLDGVAKLVKSVRAKMNKISEIEGDAQSIGQYLNRLARILKIETFFYPADTIGFVQYGDKSLIQASVRNLGSVTETAFKAWSETLKPAKVEVVQLESATADV